MTALKIRVFQSGKLDPETTVTIPGEVLKIASRFIPSKVASVLQEKGIELNEIIKLSENPEVYGTLVEIEDHTKNEKLVIALE